jgi:hypothetical protein
MPAGLAFAGLAGPNLHRGGVPFVLVVVFLWHRARCGRMRNTSAGPVTAANTHSIWREATDFTRISCALLSSN